MPPIDPWSLLVFIFFICLMVLAMVYITHRANEDFQDEDDD